MALDTGQRLGPYEIIEPAGAGGMGEVYKAKDTRLERTVALKILPEEVASTPEFKERFDREAKSISSLNHSHICTLHDVGRENGISYLVMEFLDGETLAERLTRGPIPYQEMLEISIQIASGLDSAHQQGVIHRDLKPGNIMLTAEGAKLLDFGLARSQLDGTVDGVTAITQTTPLTGPNRIVGTMQYMSPEQLEGSVADVRSDIFAFGAIMYEMSTGKRAFEGSSSATLIAAIIERDPVPISVIMPTTPPLFERLVKKCLAKDPRKRWQSASDLSDELRWISEAGSQVGLPAHIAARRKFKFGLARVVGAVAIVTTLVFAYLYYAEATMPAPEQPVARYMVNIRQGLSNIYWPRISPDGRMVAFQANDSTGANRIWVRPINSLEAYPLMNTEGAWRYMWSPDGSQLAFFVGDQLKRISATGGQTQLVSQGTEGYDGSWGNSGLIIFDGPAGGPVKVVPASGGVPRAVTTVDTTAGEVSNGWPWFLPDGKLFLYVADIREASRAAGISSVIRLGDVDSDSTVTLFQSGDAIDRIEYANAGYILYVADNNLIGLPFDADKLEVTGEPKPIAMQIGAASNTYAFSVSDNGTLLYQTQNSTSQSELAWIDRSGNKIESVGQLGGYLDVDLSPDESKIAYSIVDEAAKTTDLWIYDLKRNVPTRLTFDPANDGRPLWSPDSKQVYFNSNRDGRFYQIYRKDASGLGEAELVRSSENSHLIPTDLSPDGKMLLYSEAKEAMNVRVASLTDSADVRSLTNSSFFEAMARVSPNGKYVAYVSNESGRREVYVRRFDGSGGKWQISTEHADNPRWSKEGTELYYLTFDDQVMAVKVNTHGDFVAENPTELFKTSVRYPLPQDFPYDVSGDGQRFLINKELTESDPGEIVVVQNWAAEFKKK